MIIMAITIVKMNKTFCDNDDGDGINGNENPNTNNFVTI